MAKLPYIIGSAFLIVLSIVVISLGFFSGWVFFGMIFYIGLFVGGYFYIIIAWQNDKETEQYENQRKQKFDWCFRKANEALRNMPGGQGIEWDSGFGRVSDFKTFNDGTQNKPFRSILGYLSGTQQLVLIIYDIDNDDIVKYDANPSPDIITNHFHNFNPFKSGRSGGFGGDFAPRYDRYGRKTSRARRGGISIHMNPDDDLGGEGGDRTANYDDLKTQPDKGTVDDVFKRMNK